MNADKHSAVVFIVVICALMANLEACGNKSFEQCLIEGSADSENLTRRLHLRTKLGINIVELLE